MGDQRDLLHIVRYRGRHRQARPRAVSPGGRAGVRDQLPHVQEALSRHNGGGDHGGFHYIQESVDWVSAAASRSDK